MGGDNNMHYVSFNIGEGGVGNNIGDLLTECGGEPQDSATSTHGGPYTIAIGLAAVVAAIF
jgi:hypothetical protein